MFAGYMKQQAASERSVEKLPGGFLFLFCFHSINLLAQSDLRSVFFFFFFFFFVVVSFFFFFFFLYILYKWVCCVFLRMAI